MLSTRGETRSHPSRRSSFRASDNATTLPFQPRETLFERADRQLGQLHDSLSEEEEAAYHNNFEPQHLTLLSAVS